MSESLVQRLGFRGPSMKVHLLGDLWLENSGSSLQGGVKPMLDPSLPSVNLPHIFPCTFFSCQAPLQLLVPTSFRLLETRA